jgi:hypothetical protein
MIKPEPQIIHALAASVRQYPELLDWIRDWRLHELEQLPNTLNNTALSQGRCQVLGELYKFAKDAPAIAAKSQ